MCEILHKFMIDDVFSLDSISILLEENVRKIFWKAFDMPRDERRYDNAKKARRKKIKCWVREGYWDNRRKQKKGKLLSDSISFRHS